MMKFLFVTKTLK